jgi:hypothetical protein
VTSFIDSCIEFPLYKKGGQGRGCNTLTGWFAIDSYTLTAGALTGIDLRFEQHCEGGTPALHGQLHWTNP